MVQTYSNIRAYSYLRFSTPEQQRGDSFRRQTALAEKYALQHGLVLDTNLDFRDAGISAFRGRNASDGQFGAFVIALQEGIVPRGSYLLVESLDRISRQTPYKAQTLLNNVILAGAVVVTLSDGRKYDLEALEKDPTSLIMSILIFMRAHDESEMKSKRLKAVWSEKRSKALTTKLPMTAACPGWIELDAVTNSFQLLPDRVKVVQRIFDLTVNGVGQGVIAQTLNKESVPTFGRGKFWYRTYIAKILENAAVTGKFVPHENSYASGKLERISLEPINNYYPSIITSDVMNQVEAMRASKQSRRGRHATKPLNNIFGGLGKCALCGSTMTMTNKGGGSTYFVCTRAKAGAGCSYRTIHYNKVESYFKLGYRELLDTLPDTSKDITRIQNNLKVLNEQLDWVNDAISNLVDAIENRTGVVISTSLLERLGELEENKSKTLLLQQEELEKLQRVERNLVTMRIEALKTLLSQDSFEKEKVNAILRQLFRAIHISIDKKSLEFEWQHSSTRTCINYLNDPVMKVHSSTVALGRLEPPPLPNVPVVSLKELAKAALVAKRENEDHLLD